MLSSEQGGEAELRITYQVYQASWKPTYDIRMQMAKNQNEKSSLTVSACFIVSFDAIFFRSTTMH